MARVIWIFVFLCVITAAVWVYAKLTLEAEPDPSLACHHAAYDLGDGRVLWLSATRFEGAFRYYLMSGQTGVLRPDAGNESKARKSFTAGPGWAGETPVVARLDAGPCSDPTISFETGGVRATATRMPFDVQDTRFDSGGLTLTGRLVLPKGAGPFPIAVLVHGSERNSAVWGDDMQSMLPANGIGVFVYDKRGTGRSAGSYTQDFHVLAADAAAAMARAKVLAAKRGSSFGYLGGSQAGWVIPLAAKSGADFTVIGYGLAESPLAEDREQVMSELRAKGYGADVLAKAREITDVTGRIMASDFRDGFDELATIKAKYGTERWFAEIEGEFTGDFLRTPPWLIRMVAPMFDVGTSWTHDPVPVLKANTQPSLWLLAGKDTEAPSENTLRILRALQPALPGLDVIVFPNADHGIIEIVEQNGARRETNFSAGYFETMVAWIKTQRLDAPAPGAIKHEGGAE